MLTGTPPTPRDSHSCTTVGDNLFVFGGTDGRRPLNDLHILQTCEFFTPKCSPHFVNFEFFCLCFVLIKIYTLFS